MEICDSFLIKSTSPLIQDLHVLLPKYENLQNTQSKLPMSRLVRQFLQVLRLMNPCCKHTFWFNSLAFSLEQPYVDIFFFYLLVDIKSNISKVKVLEKCFDENMPPIQLIDLHVSDICTSRDRIVVNTLRCDRNNPGSSPGQGIYF